MSLIFVGTAYHQVYGVPLNLKSPMMKLGEKKKSPVTSIYETFTHDSIGYSDPFDTFHINLMQNEIEFSEKLPIAETSNQKILLCQFVEDQRIYCTNHGDIYYNSPENETQNNWSKLYYNEAYANVIKSLPPRRAGQLLPQYTRAVVSAASEQSESIEIGFVGRGVVPFVYSFLDKSIIWKAKNVTNDELDLQVPANDVDMVFMHNNYHLAAANADNKIRIYDVRSRRRKPISDVFLTEIAKFQKSLLTRMTKSSCEKYLYVGNDRGSIYEVDVRKNMGITHKYKGIATSIKDMKIQRDHLVVVSLDGFLRVFNTITKQKQFQRYLNIHPTVINIPTGGINFGGEEIYKVQEVNLNEVDQQEQDKKPKKVKQIRKRNKVGLKYLQTNFSYNDVKLENEDNNKIENQEYERDQVNIKNEGILDQDLDL